MNQEQVTGGSRFLKFRKKHRVKLFGRSSPEFHKITTRRDTEVIESIFLVWIQLEG